MAKRTKITLGQNSVSYSEAIRQITGWTNKEFETQKRLMRYRVKTFNEITGSNLSAIEELYYKVRFEDKRAYYEAQGKQTLEYNELQQALLDLKTTYRKGGTERQKEMLQEYTLKRFEGLVNAYPLDLKPFVDKLKNGTISINEFQLEMEAYASKMQELQKTDPARYLKEKGRQVGSP